MPKFQRNKKKKIDEILDAALKLATEKGPNNFSVNDIPEKANVSIGTVYRYFPKGKEDILHQILLRNMENVKSLTETEYKAETLEAYWAPIIRNMIKVSHRYDAVSEMMVEAAPPDSEFYHKLSTDLMSFYHEMAEEMKEYSTVVDAPVSNLALRTGLCFRLLKKILHAQEAVTLFDEEELENYMMKIVNATFSR